MITRTSTTICRRMCSVDHDEGIADDSDYPQPPPIRTVIPDYVN